MTRIAPGVYDDDRGGLHIYPSELLRAHGYADTPANRAMLVRTWQAYAQAHGIPCDVSDDDGDLGAT